MVKPLKGKKKTAAQKEEEEHQQALQEQAVAEDQHAFQITCLEIRIKELETLNLGLQRKAEYLDTQTDIYKTQLEDLREEKEDLVSHLHRCYSAEKTNVKELEDRLYGTYQAKQEESKEYERRLGEKDKKFEEMKESLEKTIQELEAHITGLEEFRMQKEKLTLEREELRDTLEAERERFSRSFDELEDNVIRYRERMKNESVEMVKNMAKDMQRAGKLCLTATVKSAIEDNVRLQDDLETTSKENLQLRLKFQKTEIECRNRRMEIKVVENENAALHKKCAQYRAIIQELVDRQIVLDRQLDFYVEMENEFISLKAEHKLCPSMTDIRKNVANEVEKLMSTESKQGIGSAKAHVDPKDGEIAKLRDLILKMGVASKALSQARTQEELDCLKDNFKRMIVKIYSAACEIPDLPEEISAVLGAGQPEMMPCFSFMK